MDNPWRIFEGVNAMKKRSLSGILLLVAVALAQSPTIRNLRHAWITA